jgi:hypothetical protein
MDPVNLSANLSLVRDHLQLFVGLLFGLPIVTFVGIQFWIAGHSAKVQRTTNWFVPTDLESDAAKMQYSMQRNSVAFAHRINRNARHPVPVRNSGPRRSA